MADPRYVVPYHDPHDSPINYEILNFLRDANPTLENLPSTDEPTSLHVSSDDIVNPNLSLEDPMIWDIVNQPNSGGQSQGEGPSLNRERRATENLEQRYLDDGKPISVWPPPAMPFQCTCCQVLREIIHTDGNCTTKLEIHGRLGIICHAVLEIKDQVMYGSSEPRYHMFDFCKKSIDSVKQFLQQYCNDQTKAGYIMVQDPLSVFYEALCVGMEWDENLQNDSSPVYSEAQQADQTEGGNEAERGSRSTLAQQCRGKGQGG
ncbi:hypothetical protein MANES_03G052300v8 [Manihot esculenta]|uniref:Uncharacterized protein n=1 Tax=Manihot esculenta TaxID=3983 RepID=A0ACB7HYJ3_MANES|nr:hypothetical protein MANES_03G052300v8 [Manihot esculenta]